MVVIPGWGDEFAVIVDFNRFLWEILGFIVINCYGGYEDHVWRPTPGNRGTKGGKQRNNKTRY